MGGSPGRPAGAPKPGLPPLEPPEGLPGRPAGAPKPGLPPLEPPEGLLKGEPLEPEAGETGLLPRNPEEGGPAGLPPKVGRPIPELRPETGLPEPGRPGLGLPEPGRPGLGLPDPLGAPKEEEIGGLEAVPPKGRFDPEGLAPSPPWGLPLP